MKSGISAYIHVYDYCTHYNFSAVVLHIWPYKSMEDRAAVRQRCAQDPELSQCGMHLMLYRIHSLPIFHFVCSVFSCRHNGIHTKNEKQNSLSNTTFSSTVIIIK